MFSVRLRATLVSGRRNCGSMVRSHPVSRAWSRTSRVSSGQSAQKPPASPFSIPARRNAWRLMASRNPELIPEWYVWETFFRQLHKAGTVPSALNLTESETRALRMEVEEFNKSNEQCQKQIESLRPLVGIASNSEVNQKQRAIQLGVPEPLAGHPRPPARRCASGRKRRTRNRGSRT